MYVFPVWDKKLLFDIRRIDVNNLLDGIKTKHGKNQADAVLRTVSAVMNWYAVHDDRFNSPIVKGMNRDRRTMPERSRTRILTDDGDDFSFLDCAYEELLQALGPINDDRSVPWSMFNDDVQMGFFDVYDQYILNILYDPRVRPGMTRRQLELILPDILPEIRKWVSGANSARRLRASNGAGSAFSIPFPDQFSITRKNPQPSD